MNMKIDESPNRICAIDASTSSLAYAIFVDKELSEYGKINFAGSDIYQKVADAARKTKAYFDGFINIDALVIEHTVFMNSPKTAADLALVQGAILGAVATSGVKVFGRVSPITWQNYIGNKKLSNEEKIMIQSQNPGKSVSWLKSYERNIRKERTSKLIDIIYDKKIDDNDVADACAIGHWAIKNWGKAVDK